MIRARRHPMASAAVAAVLAAVVLTASPAAPRAQEDGPVPPPPYEQALLRLSEILGALHYLRDLCGADDGELWRDQMQGLIDAESPDYVRRLRLADAFNRGHDSYRAVYLACTPSAEITVANFLEEGALLAGEIVARYGEDS